MDNELGARIRTLRKERGLSQEALAQALEVSRQAVTKWEDGSSLPSTANLFALSGFFGVPLAELTGTPEVAAPLPNAASISKKQRRIHAKVLKIGAWVLLGPSACRCCSYVPYSILLPDRPFQRMFRLSAALIWRQTSTLWVGFLRICFQPHCRSLSWDLVC